MKYSRRHHAPLGFSLVELMIVIAIIGILSALAAPKFRRYQIQAKQAEAKTMLRFIATNAEAAAQDGVTGAAIPLSSTDRSTGTSCLLDNWIGFKPTDCTRIRYKYDLTSVTLGGVDLLLAMEAEALEFNELVIPNCASTDDRWRVNLAGTVTDVNNAWTACGQ
jgi:prepilin-type N-terminal cleavage/methylation domain-containing protein